MTSGRRRVFLFGLSANPPTGLGGHAGIVAWAARQADEVWVLPVFRHAFHEKRHLAPFDHRVRMARLAFEHLEGLEGRVRVRETERELVEAAPAGAWIGTIDVVRRLRAEHPEVDLSLLLGADTYADLARGKWKESEALLALVPVVVVAREGGPTASTVGRFVPSEGGPGPIFAHVDGLTDVSSSAVRATRDLTQLRRVLQPAVLEYIEQHHLYAFA